MVDVDPYKFVDVSCSPQLSEIVDETGRIAGNADDGAVYVNDEGSGGIDLRPCRKRNIWRPSSQQNKNEGPQTTHPQPLADALA